MYSQINLNANRYHLVLHLTGLSIGLSGLKAGKQSAIVELCENRIFQGRDEGIGHKVLRRPAAGTMVHLNASGFHWSVPQGAESQVKK